MKKLIVTILLSACFLVGCQNTQVDGDVTNTPDQAVATVSGYIFEVNGADVGVDQEMNSVIEELGTEKNYFEATSCAFEGIDKTYSYDSYQITTYPTDGTDYIGNITLLDDLVETAEGISVYMSKQEVLDVYGENGSISENQAIYTKDNMNLVFIFEEEQVVGIEYRSKVLE